MFETLFPENKDGEGATISPRSSLRMCVEKKEVRFYTINFVSKTSYHKKFDSWGETILAQPGTKTKFNDLGIMRASLR